MVKLISVSKPLEFNTAEELIVYCARVSNPKNQKNFSSAHKLIKYCIDHKHWSIFETAFVTFEVKTTRAIAAQLLRHKSLFFQELSQRYQEVDSFIMCEARSQDKKNRQASNDDMSEEDKQWFLDAQNEVIKVSSSLYKEALDRNIAKEQARFLLPLNTETTIYVTGNLRSFIHYIQVRADKSTQKEHRDIALNIKQLICVQFPLTAKALEWIK